MKKIAADRHYKLFRKKAEEMRGYRLVSSEDYERDQILGYYKTRESAAIAGYQYVLMENKRDVEQLETELDWQTKKPYTLSQRKELYKPWKITEINIEEGIFKATGRDRNIDIAEFIYSPDETSPADIDLSENEEYVNYFNVDTSPEEGQGYPSLEGMGRRPSRKHLASEKNYRMLKRARESYGPGLTVEFK